MIIPLGMLGSRSFSQIEEATQHGVRRLYGLDVGLKGSLYNDAGYDLCSDICIRQLNLNQTLR